MKISGFGESDTGAWDALHRGTDRESFDSPSHYELSTLKTMLPHRRPSTPPPPVEPYEAPEAAEWAGASDYYDDEGRTWQDDGESGHRAEDQDTGSVVQDTGHYAAPSGHATQSGHSAPSGYAAQPGHSAPSGHAAASRPAGYPAPPADDRRRPARSGHRSAAYDEAPRERPSFEDYQPARRRSAPQQEAHDTGYAQPAHDTGYDRPARDAGYEQPAYDTRYEQPAYERSPYDSGYQQAPATPGYEQPGYQPAAYDSGYQQTAAETDYHSAPPDSAYRPAPAYGYEPYDAEPDTGRYAQHRLADPESPAPAETEWSEADAARDWSETEAADQDWQPAPRGGRHAHAAEPEWQSEPDPAQPEFLAAEEDWAAEPAGHTGRPAFTPAAEEDWAAEPAGHTAQPAFSHAAEPGFEPAGHTGQSAFVPAAEQDWAREPAFTPAAEPAFEPAVGAPAKPARSRVRPYARTGGRTRSDHNLALEALVSTSDDGRRYRGVRSIEHRRICDLCLDTRSVAEIAAHLRLPLGVVKVLVGDMSDLGLVLIHQTELILGDRSSREFMERVLQGLRAL
ncbi:DUF742 domain-containing protein [Amycolatopsis sp. NBC_00345]|uniref:DUF742 domain-containing protein n=1 Tax=Amycolatopsis sp. NBC_00345 TaxID=2975955 RepID=UPI003FA47ADC